MSITLAQNLTAIIPGMSAQFAASGGTAPYTYTILPGGAGGSIDPVLGDYTAPAAMGVTPQTLYDTIGVTDMVGNTATSTILIATPLFLFCDIIQNQLGLVPGRVYLWDQKVFQPADNDLYVIVTLASCKPFSNMNAGGDVSTQSVNLLAVIDIDILSRGPAARDRKEEIILALNSVYAQQQQEANSFYIGKISTSFINLSNVDGAAIPYRYRISVNMQYPFTKLQSVPYFNMFSNVNVVTNS